MDPLYSVASVPKVSGGLGTGNGQLQRPWNSGVFGVGCSVGYALFPHPLRIESVAVVVEGVVDSSAAFVGVLPVG